MLTGSSNCRIELAFVELAVRRGVRAFEQCHPAGVDRDGLPQLGAVGPHLLDHLRVVARPERPGVDQQGGAGLHEGIPQLGRLVCGVDVDEDGADARGGELREDPLEPIRRPDANTVALPTPDASSARASTVVDSHNWRYVAR